MPKARFGATHMAKSIDSRVRAVNSLIGVPPAPGVTVQTSKGPVSLDLTDVPPVPDEDWMPPIKAIKKRWVLLHLRPQPAGVLDTKRKFW